MTGQTSAMMALRDPDIRLMLRVRGDDPTAFAELVERFQHRLVGVMTHVVGHSQEAEDLAQEVFLRVYKTRHKYSPKAKFSTWLFTIANNLALNSIRNRQRRQTVPLEVRESGSMGSGLTRAAAADPAPPPSHQLQQMELAAVVQRALGELNERQRVAVVLNKFEDMGYDEIAEVMGLSMKAVKSLLSRARGKLRESLRPYIERDGSISDSVRTAPHDE
jgi:RNA polymerase sigma-70 factor (ECF subfamily)